MTLTVTDEAKCHGWVAAWAGRDLNIPLTATPVGYGRGERDSASLTQVRPRPMLTLVNRTPRESVPEAARSA